MTTLPTPTRQQLPTALSGSRSTGWWGMLMVIANEATLFASLIAAYFYLRFNSPAWPPTGIEPPELVLPLILTAILLSSSLFMHLAQRRIQQDDVAGLQRFLRIAFGLAIAFLALQLFEYSQTPFRPADSAYASLFFTITGIHGLHVLIAIIMNGYLQLRARLGFVSAVRHQGVENVTLYWHFVDVVWLFVLASLYLSPHL